MVRKTIMPCWYLACRLSNTLCDPIMKPLWLACICSLATACCAAQEIARVGSFEIQSEILDQRREVLTYTPYFYDETELTEFDVIYVFDAQHRESFDLVHSTIPFLQDSKHFIVVGITSPAMEELDYYRNNDMLPEPRSVAMENYLVTENPNAENFLRFVKSEVMPAIDSMYRTTGKRIAIGHSLSASLVLSTLATDPELFDAYLAISPNFAYDNNRLANDLVDINFNSVTESKFIYISHADEENYAEGWKSARESVYAHLNKLTDRTSVTVVLGDYPQLNHWNTYPTALVDGITQYLSCCASEDVPISDETYRITITVTVPREDDSVFVTGNQEALANWAPDVLEMEKVSAFTRRITVDLHSPAQLQFSRGDWKSKAYIEGTYEGANVRIIPAEADKFQFRVLAWSDR